VAVGFAGGQVSFLLHWQITGSLLSMHRSYEMGNSRSEEKENENK
jgi:hypothetical protein